MTPTKLDANGQPVIEEVLWKREEKAEMSMWTKLKNPQGTIYFPEILKAASSEPLVEDRVKMLKLWIQREQKNLDLFKGVVECLYHPAVVFDLPDTRPPFTPNGAVAYGKAPNTLYKAIRRVKYFVNCPSKVQHTAKRENLFIQELESLYKDEAELYLMMSQKKLDASEYPNINEDLFRAVMPNLLPAKKA